MGTKIRFRDGPWYELDPEFEIAAGPVRFLRPGKASDRWQPIQVPEPEGGIALRAFLARFGGPAVVVWVVSLAAAYLAGVLRVLGPW